MWCLLRRLSMIETCVKLFFPKTILSDPDFALRRAGYGFVVDRHSRQVKSYVHRLDRDSYPRFHVYVEDAGEKWSLNLHLDQRPSVYEGATAHSGEYDGAVVEREAARITHVLEKKNSD